MDFFNSLYLMVFIDVKTKRALTYIIKKGGDGGYNFRYSVKYRPLGITR